MLRSFDGNYHAVLQPDGNFVLYKATNESGFIHANSKWHTNTWTAGRSVRVQFESDGTAILKDNRGVFFWGLGYRHTAARVDDRSKHLLELHLDNSGELVIRGPMNDGHEEVVCRMPPQARTTSPS